MSSSAFTPSTTTVTNNVPVNVPIITYEQSYTPTFSNLVGGANVSFKYRRVGSSVEINGRFQTTTASPSTSTLTIGLPTGLTIDSSAIADFSLLNQYGTASVYLFSTGLTQTNKFSVALESATGGTSAFVLTQSVGVARLRESDIGQNNYVEIYARIPIAEWAGSGTTTLATRAVEEYAWNSDTTNTSTTSSGFSNGPDGVQFGSYSTATRTKRVRFQTSILPTDTIILETKDSANSQWMPYHQSRYISTSGTTGMGCNVVSSTEVDVFFASAGYASTVYSPTAAAWSGIAGSDNFKWRVRKVSGGAQVGYPVSARNIVGDTSGSVVPVGMIGEYKYQTWSGVALSVSAYVNAATVTLTQGIWQISMQSRSGSSSGNPIAGGISTDSTPSTFSDSSGGVNYVEGYVSSVVVDSSLSITPIILNITSTTNYYAKVKASTGTLGTNAGKLVAVRIA